MNLFEYIPKIEYLLLTFIYLAIAIKMFKLMKKSKNGIRALKKALFITSATTSLVFAIISCSMLVNFYKYQSFTGAVLLIGAYFIYDELG